MTYLLHGCEIELTNSRRVAAMYPPGATEPQVFTPLKGEGAPSPQVQAQRAAKAWMNAKDAEKQENAKKRAAKYAKPAETPTPAKAPTTPPKATEPKPDKPEAETK